MDTQLSHLAVLIVCASNAAIGLYIGRRGLAGLWRAHPSAIPVLLLGTGAVISVTLAGRREGFVAQPIQHIVALLIFIAGLVVGSSWKARSLRPWAELRPALARHSGKSVHIAYEAGVDGPGTAARLVCEALQEVGLKMSYASARSEALGERESGLTTDLVVLVYARTTGFLGNSIAIYYTVDHPATGAGRYGDVLALRHTTLFIMNSILKCLDQAEQVARETDALT